jgi:replication-associated recombination protein RarA
MYTDNSDTTTTTITNTGQMQTQTTEQTQTQNTYVAPWTEKWRPQNMADLVLSAETRRQLEAIVDTGVFPNLLLHGPPGTGKTSTLMALIRAYRAKWGNGPTLTLNAGDDRGTKVVRGLLTDFVNSGDKQGVHIVVMDEVDYTTEASQSAISALIHRHQHRVVFCFICNYLPRIGERLLHRCTLLRFGQLPEDYVSVYLRRIAKAEHLRLKAEQILALQYRHRSDVRSMVNELQRRQPILNIPLTAYFLADRTKSLSWWHARATRYGMNVCDLLMTLVRHAVRTGHTDPDFIEWAWTQSQLPHPLAEELLFKLQNLYS